ncbi:phosphotransferase family protein [Frankia sp. CNm7]|uniref:Phosphotransferase family protein n=1 Tax=Frankia nepalensis TaxID=1836974 RepID=A0A937RPL4_9ACTN|nr:phosphotransferase family protein [Frankia nepalensis]MBL7501174.1 phosphotransferase family protein [Frankia nepalensis]MBL7512624.1 phosphotransferase family protein [Frankia nepalensis]MBL7520044.1 phosphotransferase family protein [Frankia nepalensis]MBL7632680.1 phosphotransferase family protein [Frankia nepalensis]
MTEEPEDAVAPEVAPVRPGQELDWDRIRDYLSPRLDTDGAMEVLQFPNGSANLTYLIRFGERRFVLRRPPFGVIAPGAHDMRREHRVLSRLWRAYDRAPRAFLFCDDPGVAGSDFLVSEYRPGIVVWGAIPDELGGRAAARELGFATVDALADLHAVDPAACELDRLGRPEGFLERQLSGWRDRWGRVAPWAQPAHDAAMVAAADLLARRLPVSQPASLVHNDFKVNNCQFVAGHPERVSSVFDWDMATLADPLVDLGTLLNYWPDPADTADDHAIHDPGMETMGLPTRAEAVERYASRGGLDLAAIAWYEAFASWRVAVICQQLYARFARGESTDERMASQGERVDMLSRRALRILRTG